MLNGLEDVQMEMNTVNQVDTKRPLFRSPMFWLGCFMWIGVVLALVVPQSPLWRSSVDVDKGVSASTDKASGNGENGPSLVIKTKNDGSLEIVDGASGKKNEVQWDPNGVADFLFIDQEGRNVTKADLLGKPWVVCFVFTHCAYTCPMVTNSMRELQDRLKDCDFRLVTLTVDPERDTPEILKGYGESRGADFSKWMFLGGEQAAIYKLIQGSFQMPVKETFGKDRRPGFEFIHSNNIMLVDASGVVRGKFDATKGESMAALRREIRNLLATSESSDVNPDVVVEEGAKPSTSK